MLCLSFLFFVSPVTRKAEPLQTNMREVPNDATHDHHSCFFRWNVASSLVMLEERRDRDGGRIHCCQHAEHFCSDESFLRILDDHARLKLATRNPWLQNDGQ